MNQILVDLGLVTVGDDQAWAVISPDDRYRYLLGRVWDLARPLWTFCMINPSVARGAVVVNGVRKVVNDPTIRKCVGFAERGGAGGIVVVNLLAYSATNPRNMVRAHQDGVDVRGEHNRYALKWALDRSVNGRRIAAWGKIPPPLRSVVYRSQEQFRLYSPDCFGFNHDGSPRHPLMLGYDTPIIEFGALLSASQIADLANRR